jgi:torulene dioxygenase
MTENYLIITEAPLYYNNKGLNAMLHGSVLSSMKWDGDEPTYFHVISRYPKKIDENGLVTSIPFPSFFQFHTANAYEKIDANGHTILTLDCASFSNGDIFYQVHDFGLPRDECATSSEKHGTYFNGIAFPPSLQDSFADLCRYKLNLDTNRIDEKIVILKNIEFPRFNQDYMMEDYSYVYGCELKAGSSISRGGTGIIKVNVKDKTSISYHDDGSLCSEPIFVKRPGSHLEDDGVLLVLANEIGSCYLVILNATDLKEEARLEIGGFTPTTFHGSYVDYEFKSVNVN